MCGDTLDYKTGTLCSECVGLLRTVVIRNRMNAVLYRKTHRSVNAWRCICHLFLLTCLPFSHQLRIVKYFDSEAPSIGHHNEICACTNFTNPVRLTQKLKFYRIRTLLSNKSNNPVSVVMSHSCRNQDVDFLSNTFNNHVRISLLKSYENQI